MKVFIKYLKLTFLMAKHNLQGQMEYRFSFITKVVGMAINDTGIILVWALFFNYFKDLNGWRLGDTVILFAVGTLSFALVRIFAGGIEEMARKINRGELDYYMTLPKNLLWQVSTSRLDVSALGDALFAFILICFFTPVTLSSFVIFLLVSLISAGIVMNFLIIVHSIGFFVGNFEEGADRLLHSVLGFSLYPENSFYGLLKTISLTLLPAFFMVWLPLRLIKDFQLYWLGGLLGFWLITLLFSIWFFNKGLKRYESGNLINVKL